MSARIAASAPTITLPPLSRLLVSLAYGIAAWDDRRRTRAALARLDRHLLRDVGLDPARVSSECAKPFWQD